MAIQLIRHNILRLIVELLKEIRINLSVISKRYKNTI